CSGGWRRGGSGVRTVSETAACVGPLVSRVTSGRSLPQPGRVQQALLSKSGRRVLVRAVNRTVSLQDDAWGPSAAQVWDCANGAPPGRPPPPPPPQAPAPPPPPPPPAPTPSPPA